MVNVTVVLAVMMYDLHWYVLDAAGNVNVPVAVCTMHNGVLLSRLQLPFLVVFSGMAAALMAERAALVVDAARNERVRVVVGRRPESQISNHGDHALEFTPIWNLW